MGYICPGHAISAPMDIKRKGWSSPNKGSSAPLVLRSVPSSMRGAVSSEAVASAIALIVVNGL